MASTPSASALSAVLRCRGNIWTRNPPTKRPVTTVYSLGLAGGVLRDSLAERTRSKQASAWEAFLQGERVLVGRRLTVAYKSPRVDGKVLRENCRRGIHEVCHHKVSQSPGDAHSAVRGVQNALVLQMAHRLTSNLLRIYNISQIIKYRRCATQVCKIVFVHEINESPAGTLKVSITSPCLKENAGQMPSFMLTGWSTLKSTCLFLTALVSELMFVKLAVLWRSSSNPNDAPQHLLSQQEEKNDALQVNGQIHSPTDLSSTKDNSGSGQRITEDRPD